MHMVEVNTHRTASEHVWWLLQLSLLLAPHMLYAAIGDGNADLYRIVSYSIQYL